MNINDERGIATKVVRDLQCGEVFESDCKFYIRTENLINSYVSCVNLANGVVKYFECISVVHPVVATMTIEG